ncbi:MAG: hypothetical protein JWN74_797 [Acidobacteriaceae bacterium]|nr:hypothetical protein [Acidobacteriaceae bacterium]
MQCLLLASAVTAFGQSTSPSHSGDAGSNAPGQQNSSGSPSDSGAVPDNPQPDDSENKLVILPRQLLRDQIGMWTSPARLRLPDATWLVPLGGFTAALFATDTDVSRHLSTAPNTLLRYRHISDYGVYSMAGGAGGLYLLGLMTHNDHQRETGFLSGEAALDGLAAVEAIKFATGRERPFQDNASGKFWQGGTSFPSEHSALSWSIAGIVAHEYPSPFTKFLSYGAATAISASRITAKQHFPSDVLVGAAIGYLTSEYVYRHHHDPELRGGGWELPAVRPEPPSHWEPNHMGSPYVPLDTWIYPALDRLAALGYVNSATTGMRPWTRLECARQIEEASERISDDEEGPGEAARLYQNLQSEFSHEVSLLSGGENGEVRVESVYSRSTEIVGKPLTDGYHFGQTVINDYGRPEEQGFNNVSGLSGWAAAGPFAAYVRAEYQRSPSASAFPLTAREAISQADFGGSIVRPPFPVPSGTPTPSLSRAHLLDSYVAMNLSDWQLSYGKQSLWWGPDAGGALMLSDNAEPLRMFRINRVTPLKLPGFLGLLGPTRVEFFIGQYAGYNFVFTPKGLIGGYDRSLSPEPIVHGERLSFKPTTNLEIGLSRTTDYGGPNYPLTLHTFFRSAFSTSNTIPGAPNKPGSRRSGMDFNYRVPGFRNALTLYAEGMAEHNEITPLLGPDVAAWLAGIYVPRLPVRKMDLRVEGVYTDPPIGGNVGHGFFYYDPTWITGYQNSGHLMGNWVGRQGQGVQAWTTYWFNPRDKLQFGFRHQKVSHQFIPNGGTVSDASVRAEVWRRSILSLSAMVQYEAWTFPVITPNRQSNVTSSVEVSFWPKSIVSRTPSQ